jgi:hypothetical protein
MRTASTPSRYRHLAPWIAALAIALAVSAVAGNSYTPPPEQPQVAPVTAEINEEI